MTRVKGSRAYRYRVMKYQPLRWLAGWVLLALTVAALASGSFHYGKKLGLAERENAQQNLVQARRQLKQAEEAAEEVRQQLTNLSLGAKVDKNALEVVRAEVTELKQQIALLEEENQFYRNLMAPTDNKRGLTFGAVEISQTDQPRTYRYKVVMQQLATQHDVLVGTLSFNVVGRLDGALRVFALRELAADVTSTNIKLRFKYFQNLEGQLVLPQGFEPERIELEARSSGANSVTVEKRFGWLVEEPI